MRSHSRSRWGAVAITLGLAVGLTGMVATPAQAAETTVIDEAGLLTAIGAANSSVTGPDIITFGADIDLTRDVPEITADTTIDGAGFTLDAAGHDGFVFEGDPGDSGQHIAAAIRGLTITGAYYRGIKADNTHLTLTDVMVIHTDGTGIWVEGGDLSAVRVSATLNSGAGLGAREGHVLLRDSRFNDNGEVGAGILPGDSDVTIQGSEFNGNNWGGLRVTAPAGTTIDITGSRAEQNTFAGVFVGSAGTVKLDGLRVDENEQFGLELQLEDPGAEVTASNLVATDNGFTGIDIEGTGVAVELSLVTSLGNGGSGIIIHDQNGMFDEPLTPDDLRVEVRESTFSLNSEHGIYVQRLDGDSRVMIDRTTVSNSGDTGVEATLRGDSRLDVVNSTFSGNASDSGPAGVSVRGDGTASVALQHSTVSENEGTVSDAPGVWFEGVDARVSHSILAGNQPTDLGVGTATVLAVDYTLIESSAGRTSAVTTAIRAGAGNLSGLDPLLGALADNGGQTLTHLPAAGSPVVDAGQTTTAGAPALDQRGEPRGMGTAIDFGAVELLGPVMSDADDTAGGATAGDDTAGNATDAGGTDADNADQVDSGTGDDGETLAGTGDDGETLADTGFSAGSILPLAFVLLATGAGLLVWRRRVSAAVKSAA